MELRRQAFHRAAAIAREDFSAADGQAFWLMTIGLISPISLFTRYMPQSHKRTAELAVIEFKMLAEVEQSEYPFELAEIPLALHTQQP
jgi:hypothetical protein